MTDEQAESKKAGSREQESSGLPAHSSLLQAPCSLEQLRDYAKTFPSQGGVEIGPWLERYAAEVPAGSAIIELGTWLGAGTAQLALGALKSGAMIHTYDSFKAGAHHRIKAAKRGIALTPGENVLPRVVEALKPFGDGIVFHKKKITDAKWQGPPIGLYVDDATKLEPVWLHAMAVFGPWFIAKQTLLVLMDYHFDEKAGEAYGAQKRYMAENKQFTQIEDRIGNTSTAVFRYLG